MMGNVMKGRTCVWCGAPIPAHADPRKKYCGASCRVAAAGFSYRNRQGNAYREKKAAAMRRLRLARRLARTEKHGLLAVRGFDFAMKLRKAAWEREGRWAWARKEDFRARLGSLPIGMLERAVSP